MYAMRQWNLLSSRCMAYPAWHYQGQGEGIGVMRSWPIIVVVFAASVGMWILIFSAMEKMQIEYQECGGIYCPAFDVPKKDPGRKPGISFGEAPVRWIG